MKQLDRSPNWLIEIELKDILHIFSLFSCLSLFLVIVYLMPYFGSGVSLLLFFTMALCGFFPIRKLVGVDSEKYSPAIKSTKFFLKLFGILGILLQASVLVWLYFSMSSLLTD